MAAWANALAEPAKSPKGGDSTTGTRFVPSIGSERECSRRTTCLSCPRTLDILPGVTLASAGPRPTATNSFATAILRALEASGVDSEEIARHAGVSKALGDPTARIHCEDLDRLVALATGATEASDGTKFVLEVAQHMPAIAHHLYFAMLASETVEDAVRRAVRFQRIFSDEFTISVETRGPLASVRFRPPEPRESPWFPADVAAVGIVLVTRSLLMDPQERPSAVELRRPEPADSNRLRDVFQCPIRYGMRANEILWPTAMLQRRLPLANPQIVLEAERAVVEYLANIDQSRFESRVRQVLMESLPSATHDRRRVAQKLGVSIRTLSRALADEGTSYRDILDEVREVLARAYLRDARSTVGDIALRLGFSDTSAFSRAFHRWTDQAPTEYAEASAT